MIFSEGILTSIDINIFCPNIRGGHHLIKNVDNCVRYCLQKAGLYAFSVQVSVDRAERAFFTTKT